MLAQTVTASLVILRVIKRVRTDDRRWKLHAYSDHPSDYLGALGTARTWTKPDEIESGDALVTISIRESEGVWS